MKHILIVDDDLFFRKVTTKLLTGNGYDVTAVESGAAALQTLHSETFDLMISDINMAPMNGMELLEKVRESYAGMSVIMLTGHGEIEVAIDAMKKGAFDFLAKPFELKELFATVQRALGYADASVEHKPVAGSGELPCGLVAVSEAMRRVCGMIRRIAPSDVTVLLCGERGTDKEAVARALHGNSPRKEAPFVVFDCSAHPEELNMNLLGKAPGGTLLLNHIETLSADGQRELFNIIERNQSGAAPTDARIVVASDGNLETLIGEKTFCETLYDRLRSLQIDLPPLRSCREDIPFLVNQILRRKLGPDAVVPCLDSGAQEVLYHHVWLGNTRELKEAVLHALNLAKEGVITRDMLPKEIVAVYEEGLRSQTITKPENQMKGQAFKAFLRGKQEKLLESVREVPDPNAKLEKPPERRAGPESDEKKRWKWI